jgi:hypothetical protein
MDYIKLHLTMMEMSLNYKYIEKIKTFMFIHKYTDVLRLYTFYYFTMQVNSYYIPKSTYKFISVYF